MPQFTQMSGSNPPASIPVSHPMIRPSSYRSSSLGDRRRSQRIMTVCLSLVPLTMFTLYKFWRFNQLTKLRIDQSKAQSIKARTNDITELATHFFTVLEEHSGGPMSNACVHSAVRLPSSSNDSGIVMFTSGGWANCPHSQYPLPVYESPVQRQWLTVPQSDDQSTESEPQSEDQSLFQRIRNALFLSLDVDQSPNPSKLQSIYRSIHQRINLAINSSPQPLPLSASEIDALDLYWMCRSLGQSRLYNTSFAVFLALAMNQSNNQSDDDESSSQLTFTFQGRAIRLISLSVGTFLPPIKRPTIDVVCEIGTISHSKTNDYVQQNFGQPPSLADPNDFASIVDFGTQRIAAYQSINQSMPAGESADVDDVIWAREHFKTPRDQDVWITFEISNNQLVDESTEQTTEQSNKTLAKRYHLDLSAAQYGLHAEPHYQTTNESLTVMPYLASLQSNNQSNFNMFQWAHPHPSSKNQSTILSPPPTPYIIDDAQLTNQGGSINQSISGKRAILDYAKRVLIHNDRHVNVEYSAFRRVMSEACKLRGIKSRSLYKL